MKYQTGAFVLQKSIRNRAKKGIREMRYLGLYLLIINITAFILYGADKRKAKHHQWRIPEKSLILAALLGGSAGALLGMAMFHHKTRRLLFTVGIPVILLLQLILAGVGAYYVFHGNGPEILKDSIPQLTNESAEKSLIVPEGMTLAERIAVPEGYTRTPAEEGSLTAFLRHYPMEPDGEPVRLYDGRTKQGSHVAVFSMHLGEADLQQCADSVIRVYAEYFRSIGRDDKIAFHFVSGFLCDWDTYKSGKRVSVDGNQVSWTGGGAASDSDEAFEGYLNTVFNYASTLSMKEESSPIGLSDIQTGDIFIKAGAPGHVVMVADTCEKEGKKAFLLAQGYMPAQQFHVLKNDLHEGDPWYYEEEVRYPFHTPQYTFEEGSLMRPGYLNE